MLLKFVKSLLLSLPFFVVSQLQWVKEASHHPVAMQLGLDFSAMLITIGVLIFMIPVLDALFLTPLKEALDARTKYLEDTYAEAEGLKQRMETLRSAYEEKLAKSEAEARAQIQAAIHEAQQMKEQILNEARRQAGEIRKQAQEDIVREREKMLVDLRMHVVEMTLIATEKLIGKQLDEEANRRLVEEFIESVEVKQ